MADANIRAVITADDRASATLKGFSEQAQGVGSNLTKVFGAISAAIVVDKIKDFAVSSIKAFSESQDLIAQTNATLKSTGGIAGVTADEVTKLASAWQKQSQYSDEAVRRGENLLLTFTNIGKDIFPRATQAMLDMSTTMHQDVSQSAVQLGKALQSPLEGMSALSRTGALNRDDMDKLKAKWESTGTPVYQQQIELLQALEKEFKGSAEAAGTTFSGSIEKLKNRFNDLQEIIGGKIAIAITAFANQLPAIGAYLSAEFTPLLNRLNESMQRFGDAFTRLNNEHPKLVQGMIIFAQVIGGTVIKSIEAMITIESLLIDFWTGVINVINGVANAFRSMGNTAIQVAAAMYAPFKLVFDQISAGINAVVNLFNRAKSDISGAPGKAASGLGGLLGKIPGFAEGGTVPGAIGQPQLAVVHGGEYVIPNGGKSPGGGAVNVSFNGVFTGNEMEFRKLAIKVFQAASDVADMKNNEITGMTTQDWRRV